MQMRELSLFINGQWTDSSSQDAFETTNPATGEVLARCAAGNEEDVAKAVDAAAKSFGDWKRFPAPRRGEIIFKAASILRQRKKILGEMVTKEMGKVIAEGEGDVQEAVDFLEYIAGEGRRMLGETTTSELPGKRCMTVRQPVGIVGCITPWNFPFAVPSWKLGAALIAGNTVVFKPSSLTPLCATALVEVFQEAGTPPGVLNMVTGSAQTVGQAIVEEKRIRTLSFTGGVVEGREIYSRAAKKLKRVALELGSKNPLIVMDDADIDLVLEGILFGAFGTAGQRCTATSRGAAAREGLWGSHRSTRPKDPIPQGGGSAESLCGHGPCVWSRARAEDFELHRHRGQGRGEIDLWRQETERGGLRKRIFHRAHSFRGEPRPSNHQGGDLRSCALGDQGRKLRGGYTRGERRGLRAFLFDLHERHQQGQPGDR